MGQAQNIAFNLALLGLPLYAFSQSSPPDVEKDFTRAAELIQNGRESEALVSLTDFLRRHPESKLADDAQLLVGHLYSKQRNFLVAAIEFEKVFVYKDSDRLAEAAVELGQAWTKLGQSERARIEFEAVLRRYPKSDAASQAKVLLAGLKK
jgi:TolA-binding protein